MYNNNLKTIELEVTKENPFSMVLPEGYIKIINRRRFIQILGADNTKIYEAGQEIRLKPGHYYMTTIQLDEELEYNKIIDLQLSNGLKSKSKSFLIIIRGNFTAASALASKVHQTYNYNDPGCFSEYSQAIDQTVNRINMAMRDLSDSNINKAKEIIQYSIGLVAKKYAIANHKVIFESFD